MGGSGGGGFRSDRSPSELREAVQRELQQAKLEADVNSFLGELLVSVNNRNVDLINARLDEIEAALSDLIEHIDRLLYGGSVAKHTYVDGLSDIDSLVVLKAEGLAADTPQALIQAMYKALRRRLDMGQIDAITQGFALTVRYKDGNEIQLLPAVERNGRVAISDKSGSDWSLIRPKAFEETLAAANREQGGRVVPTIKLAKAVVDATLTDRDKPGGYHMEALAVDAFREYAGPRSSKAMLTHFFQHASERIKQPIADITGQSARIDEALGSTGSPDRQRVAGALRRIASRMRSATTAAEWRDLLTNE